MIGRQVPAYKLRSWLLAKGFAEEKRGYGHVSAEDLADALLATFDVRYLETEASEFDGQETGDG